MTGLKFDNFQCVRTLKICVVRRYRLSGKGEKLFAKENYYIEKRERRRFLILFDIVKFIFEYTALCIFSRMVEIDFCDTETTLFCVIESIFSLTPLIVFLILGYYSYSEAAKRNAYLRVRFTTRHIIKVGLSSALSFSCLAMAIIYPLVEPDISLKTEITWVLNFILWLINAILIRIEYKNLGYTTNYLRAAWITMLVCQTLNLIMGLSNNSGEYQKVAIIYYVSEAGNVVIICVGYLFQDDFPPQRTSGLYDSIINSSEGGEEAPEADNPLDRSQTIERSYSASGGDPINPTGFRPLGPDLDNNMNRSGKKRDDKRKNFDDEGRRIEESKKPEKVNTFYTEPVDIKNDINYLESIEVSSTKEAMRDDKPTTVYVIDFFIKKQAFQAERSYNEFKSLYDEVTKINKNKEVVFPALPPKSLKKNDETVINERKKFFQDFLNTVLKEKIGIFFLGDFLQPRNILSYYGKKIKKPQKSSMNAEKPATADIKSNDPDVRPRAQTKMTSIRAYDVVCVEAGPQGKDHATHYTMKITDMSAGGKTAVVLKRYNDFKTLHEELKKKFDKSILPPLPYKGDLGVFEKESVVVEYRKGALKEYLSLILNNAKFQDHPFLLEFIR